LPSPSPEKPRRKSRAFAIALRALRDSLDESQGTFGARLGVTQRTMTRWEVDGELPPLAQRKHLATVLGGARPDLVAPLHAALGLPADFVQMLAPAPMASAAPVSTDAARAALDTAVATMAEDLDVGPRKLRAAVVELLRCLQETGLPLEAARLLLTGSRVSKRGRT
jgi:DNA-binding XRE family transcriptional regulator